MGQKPLETMAMPAASCGLPIPLSTECFMGRFRLAVVCVTVSVSAPLMGVVT